MELVTREVNPGRYPMGIGMPAVGNFTQDDELRLLDKLSNAVRRHEFNAGVFIGQAGEVVRSVEGTAKAFLGIALSLKKGDLGGALRFLSRTVSGSDLKAAKKRLGIGDLAGTHLSLVYGWLPLLSDVKAACDALEVVANPPRRSSVTVRHGRIFEADGSQSPSLYRCIGQKRVSRNLIYRMTEELSEQRKLGLLDPVSIAWERVPYSFVADWFVPIGTYLSNLAVIPHLKGEFCISDRVKWDASCVVTDAGEYNYGGGSAVCHHVTLTRTTQNNLFVPLPTFRGFASLYRSSQRTVNAIALIANLYRK